MEQSEKLKKLKNMVEEGVLTTKQYNNIIEEELNHCDKDSDVPESQDSNVAVKEKEHIKTKNIGKAISVALVLVILISVFAIWDKSRIEVKAEEEYKTNLIDYYNQSVACSNAIYKESMNISEKWDYLEAYWDSKEEKKSNEKIQSTYEKVQETFSKLKTCPNDFKDDYQSLVKSHDTLTAYYNQVTSFSSMDKATFNQLTGEKYTAYQTALENLSIIVDEYCELEDDDSQK